MPLRQGNPRAGECVWLEVGAAAPTGTIDKAYRCNETTCPLRVRLPRLRVRGREYSRDAP